MMMKFAQRIGGDSLKWSMYLTKKSIPLSLADSDFTVSDSISKAIIDRVSEGALGYGVDSLQLKNTVADYCLRKHGWKVDPSWVVLTSGISLSLNIVRMMTSQMGRPGGLTSTPTYHRLFRYAGALDYEEKRSLLAIENGVWKMQYSDILGQIDKKTGAYFLCNPHNPVGRSYSKSELEILADICLSQKLLICSDEAHSDIILSNNIRHTPIATLSKEVEQSTITLISPGKGYNISGLNVSFAIIANRNLREKFNKLSDGLSSTPNILSIKAADAAYSSSDAWLSAQLKLLNSNHAKVFSIINSIPQLSMGEVEATYLAWINVENLPVESPQSFFDNYGVYMSNGEEFSQKGFLRLNFACNPEVLDEALSRIQLACRSLR
ncbi:cystathionine beta-lyase [Sinobacterium caligoides]|uniref:cysteine-S-conjugate beta-lyase n=1 Tax=Sinobacterium caligoides TaxID=933926 RepID=A0A3N2DMR5_9GAMM|nr:aminotransferase class I/II-fold pyridoxal phosphate-dependent enzyme [Sinobacterium caligoides]ROS01091.1 cystathionine beta-lyase [Sinobacterium caligoides]